MAREKVEWNLTSDRIQKTLKKSTDETLHERLSPYAETGVNFVGEFDYGDNIQSAIERHGEEAVFSKYKIAASLDLGGKVRDWLEAGHTAKEIQAKLDEHVFNTQTRGPRKSDEEKYLDAFSKKTPEEQAAALAELQAKLAEMQSAA